MASQMIIRIEAELKDKVSRAAKAEGKTTSEVVRSLIEAYVRDRDMGAYIDGLWERIGTRLASRGMTEKDVPKAARDARGKK